MDKTTRRYLRHFLVIMVLYVISVVISVRQLPLLKGTVGRIVAAIAPVLPLLLLVWAFLKYLNNVDELQQKIHLNAIAWAAGMTGLITMTIGFLENVGLPRLSWLYIFPLMMALWGIGLAFFTRRYS